MRFRDRQSNERIIMKSKLLIGSAALLSVGAVAWAAKDPVVMTINGEDVPKSEFEYLYHKNSQQQIEAQPLDEYIGMFELYKMKVADAKAEGIDTTAAFISEMNQYRRDLATPYLVDSVYLNKLVDEAYNHSLEEVDYYHIMFPKGRSEAEHKATLQSADSVRNALVGGADFETLARQYSMDRAVSNNGGHMGYVASGRLPYKFEKAGFSLKPGEISDVIESNFGYHIIKVGDRRPSKGSVRAGHIMKAVRSDASPEDEARAKAQIDSLYQILSANPEEFEKLATTESEDPGSARMGGQLGWFVAGMMVPEFSETAFELPNGGVSKPVRSNYGWHIIKKYDSKGVASKEEQKPEILKQMADQRDERYKMIRDNRDRNLAAKHKASRNENTLNALKAYVASNGLDSAFYAVNGGSGEVLYTINGNPGTVGEFVAVLNNSIIPDGYIAGLVLEDKFETSYDNALTGAEEDWLYANNDDYRNLLNEYRDGSLLYEVSLRKVWDKAANDEAGLNDFFAKHKKDYKFKEPRAKGYLVLAKDEESADKIKARFAELPKDSVLQELRNEFRQVAVIDRLLAPEGLNRYVDKIMFNGPDPELNSKYPIYFILDGRVITEPEEMSDVKGAVTSDYQQLLEQNWTTELRKKYPVKRNKAELKKIK